MVLAILVAGCATTGPSLPMEGATTAPVPRDQPRPAVRTDDVLAVGPTRLRPFDASLPAATAVVAIGVRVPLAHEVRSGDTLFAIARQHLGSGARWRELLEANPRLPADGVVQVGQVVLVP